MIIVGSSFQEHCDNLRTAFDRIRNHNLKLKPRKCHLLQTEVCFLGRTVNAEGVSISEENVNTVLYWPVPTSTKAVEAFWGYINYHRQYIDDCARLACPLYALTGGRQTFVWQDHHQHAFESLKSAVVRATQLTLPNAKDLFILDTDASDVSIGAELSQLQDGIEKVVSHGS